MHRSLATALLLAASLLTLNNASLAQAQLSGTPEELREFLYPRPNTVSINGGGELTAYKDVAKVSLLVSTEKRSLSEAMTSNQELRIALVDEFLAAGIPQQNINNSKFSSSPQFGLFGRNPNSFEVTARMEVTVASEEHLQLLAAAADENEEVKFESTEFEHSAEEAFEKQVRELALTDVMEQKAYYETTLGLKLEAINFFHGGIRQMSRAMPMARASLEMESFAAGGADRTTSSAAPIVAPTFDEVEYQTSVTVVFEIISEN